MTDLYQWRGLIKAVAVVQYPFFLFVYINFMNNSAHISGVLELWLGYTSN